MKLLKFFILLLVGLMNSSFSQAQVAFVMKLNTAIDSALSNNLQLRNDKLYLQYLSHVKKAAISLPNTVFNFEYGQFNSAYQDNRIGLSQNFQSPYTLIKQQQVALSHLKAHQFQIQWKENELKQEVSNTFNTMILLSKKIVIWAYADSLYQLYLDKVLLKKKWGETDKIELTQAQIQKVHTTKELLGLQNKYQAEQLYLSYLLNTNQPILPDTTDWHFKLNEGALLYNTAINPLIKEQGQLVQQSLRRYQLEKAKFSPDFQIGMQSITIQGTGADNQNYDLQTRFNSIQGGVIFPLFFGTQLQNVKAQKISYTMAQHELEIKSKQLSNKYKILVENYNASKYIHQLYSQVLACNQFIIANEELFEKGAISFLDFSLLMSNAIANEIGALDAKFQLNQSIIQLNYFQ
jgi:cobalt-zinc-cadmium resistance protein CzcA